VASIVAGAVAYVAWQRLTPDWPADLLAFGVSAVALVAVSLVTLRRDAPLPLHDQGGAVLEYRDRLGVIGWTVRGAPK
jgi:hypothetical protein